MAIIVVGYPEVRRKAEESFFVLTPDSSLYFLFSADFPLRSHAKGGYRRFPIHVD